MVSGTAVAAFDDVRKTVKAVLFVQFAGPVNIHNDNVKNRRLNLLLQTVTVHRYKPSTRYIRQP